MIWDPLAAGRDHAGFRNDFDDADTWHYTATRAARTLRFYAGMFEIWYDLAWVCFTAIVAVRLIIKGS